MRAENELLKAMDSKIIIQNHRVLKSLLRFTLSSTARSLLKIQKRQTVLEATQNLSESPDLSEDGTQTLRKLQA